MANLDASSSANYTSNPYDPLFHVCWRRQSCSNCLVGDVSCSWCPISSTCVPNPTRLPIFAPISSAHICPLGPKERWELRAVPFGCNASTITVLAVVVAVLGSLALVGLGFLVFWLVQGWRTRCKETEYERLDGQEQESPWCACLDCGMLASLLTSVGGQGQDQGQGQSRDLEQQDVEGDEDVERRPLLLR